MFKKSARFSFKKGVPAKSTNSAFFNLRFRENNNGLKCAFIIGRKVDKRSTVRNKIKRRFSEALKKILGEKTINFDLVFYLKKELEDKSFLELQSDLKNILEKAKII